MDIKRWNQRFIQQANWTKNLRAHLLSRFSIPLDSKILEVGSGTSAVLQEYHLNNSFCVGVDLSLNSLMYSRKADATINLTCGDAHEIPLSSSYFDITYCHYLLLWVKDPMKVIREMKRVTKKGGIVAAFAEPDYQARIDHPDVFIKIGQLQNYSLQFQGVNLSMGRQLAEAMVLAGLKDVRAGVLAGEWNKNSISDFESEWSVIANDLGGLVTPEKIVNFRSNARDAWIEGSVTFFVPTFYAFGRV
jgi:SAM-dependent methyltransferase